MIEGRLHCGNTMTWLLREIKSTLVTYCVQQWLPALLLKSTVLLKSFISWSRCGRFWLELELDCRMVGLSFDGSDMFTVDAVVPQQLLARSSSVGAHRPLDFFGAGNF